MTNKLFDQIYLINKDVDKKLVQKHIIVFGLIYILISIIVRYFIRDILFRTGIYEEWFIDLTTIGPFIQAVLLSAGMMHYTLFYGNHKLDIPLFLKSILVFGIGLSLFRWFIIMILGGGILVLLDLQDHGIVQTYVEEHFIVDVVALFLDWAMLRFFYKRSAKKFA